MKYLIIVRNDKTLEECNYFHTAIKLEDAVASVEEVLPDGWSVKEFYQNIPITPRRNY